MSYASIRPGQTWLDTNGKRIQAHAGGIFYENETYYWYGENKEFTTGKDRIWTWGIRCYSSKDLYNWTDLGLIIEPDTSDETSLLHPNNWMDRPHILYNEATKKYICWIKFSGEIGCFAVFTADQLLGPYQMVRERMVPYGKMVGDFDIIQEEENAYIYFEYDHNGIAAYQLSKDYTDVIGNPVLYYEGLHAPFTREGVGLFEHENMRYMVTSGMTGYIPNPSEIATFDRWLGRLTIQGNPHKNDESGASFNSQISTIFHHPKKKNLYIALADRWVPDYMLTQQKTDIIMI